MKIYIFADLEGCSGVSCSKYVNAELGRPDLVALGRSFMAADINACIEGCFRAGADEVVVRDGHGGSSNVSRNMIDPRADLVEGFTDPRKRFPELDGAEAVILLGYHTMAGTRSGILEHTYNSKGIQNVWLNGQKTGETGIDAAIAAEYGIPVVLVTGDDRTCAEAEARLPGVVTCEVKKGLTNQGARLPSLEKTHALITEKTIEALKKRSDIPIRREKTPAMLKVELIERGTLPAFGEPLDGRTCMFIEDSVEKAWALSPL